MRTVSILLGPSTLAWNVELVNVSVCEGVRDFSMDACVACVFNDKNATTVYLTVTRDRKCNYRKCRMMSVAHASVWYCLDYRLPRVSMRD